MEASQQKQFHISDTNNGSAVEEPRKIPNHGEFELIETDSFILVSDFHRAGRSGTMAEADIAQALLGLKINRKRELQKRFQRFSEIFWLVRIARNRAKLGCKNTVKSYEDGWKQLVASLKNVGWMEQIAGANEVGATKADIKIVREKLASIYHAKQVCYSIAKYVECDISSGQIHEVSSDSNPYVNLAMIESECENLEARNAQLTKNIFLTVTEIKEAGEAVGDFKKLVFERRKIKSTEEEKKVLNESIEARFKQDEDLKEEEEENYSSLINEDMKKLLEKTDEDYIKENEAWERRQKEEDESYKKFWEEQEESERQREEAYQLELEKIEIRYRQKLKALEESDFARIRKKKSEAGEASGLLGDVIIVLFIVIIIFLVVCVSFKSLKSK